MKALSILWIVGFVVVALRLNGEFFMSYVGYVAGTVALQDTMALGPGAILRLREADRRALAIAGWWSRRAAQPVAVDA